MEDKLKAAVTGGTGVPGASIAAYLSDKGYEVACSDDESLPIGFEGADILVLAHGPIEEPDWLECSGEEWRKLRSAGLDTVFADVQAYANARLAAGVQGSVIIVTADEAHADDGSDVLRSTLSWGVRGLVRNASATYARKGVRVNSVCVNGDAFADAAPLAELLATSEHITGQTIPVAGGRALL